jgi:L,D-transpeptidase YbiS
METTMIVTIRSRALSFPRRVAARAGAVSQRVVELLGQRAPAKDRGLEDGAPGTARAAALARAGEIGADLVGRDFAPSRPIADDVGVEAPVRRRWPRRLAIAALVACALFGVALRGTGYRYAPLPLGSATPPAAPPSATADLKALTRENRKLRSEMDRHSPRGVYVVVDRANNRLYLKRGDEVLLEAVCSSGSGMILREPNGDRRWVFDTPSGTFRVLSKAENPVWRKPDWAFIEEGVPVPKDPGERIEYGMLGEYGLYFGDGYLIHGTLYERLLGRSVTHGCIRLGRDDLRQVYRATTIGTPIYIF